MKRITIFQNGFIQLGNYLRAIEPSDPTYVPLMETLIKARQTNAWFTEKNCLLALKSWGTALTEEALNQWIREYTFNENPQKTVGLILAGNIPLVGFHDIISVLICGHKACVKLSSTDPYLIPFLYEQLVRFEPKFKDQLEFTQGQLKDYDAIIATGSNNAARYFNYYFDKVPHIIRKNRNGIAVLNGKETVEDLKGLAQDIVQYFGLGCRSISKVYVPEGYDLNLIFGALYPHSSLMESAKYANNYDYNKAVFLMSEYQLLDNGFLLMRESSSFGSPVACLNYQYYSTIDALATELEKEAEQIQCISSNYPFKNSIPLGKAQTPNLWDYADGVDPIAFLLKL